LSFVRIFGDVGSAVFGGGIIEATLHQPIWGTALALRIAEFVAALIFIHLLLGVAAWLIAIASRAAWPRSPVSQRKWALLWFVLLAAWILLANAAWRPWSSLGRPYTDIASTSW